MTVKTQAGPTAPAPALATPLPPLHVPFRSMPLGYKNDPIVATLPVPEQEVSPDIAQSHGMKKTGYGPSGSDRHICIYLFRRATTSTYKLFFSRCERYTT